MSDELDEKSVTPDQIIVSNEHDRDARKDDSVADGREKVLVFEDQLGDRYALTSLNTRLEHEIKMEGLQAFFELRKRWSWWIISWITGLIVFNACLALSVGLEWLKFADYEWFITAVTVETFLQIVGMGYVAVRFLFKDPGK